MSHRESVPPLLSVAPVRSQVDERFKVTVENLPPGRLVTIRSLHHSEDQDDWEAYGRYVSDENGTVSVSDDASLGGTFSGKEPMGLLWSMRPVPGSRTGLRLRKMNIRSPMLVDISVHDGHDDGFRQRAPLASALVERWYMAPGVQRVDVRDGGVKGTMFIPPGPGPFPGMLDMWGGGGGLIEYRAALLASHGYVALALEYFGPGELDSADLQFKYFEAAFSTVKNHPKVRPDSVGILGLSLGALITVLLAAESSVVNPRCCVCVSSNYSYYSGQTLNGINRKWRKHFDKAHVDENNHHSWKGVGLAVMSESDNKVDVGKIKCPLLLVNGEDDQNWPSVETAQDIARMMRAAGKHHLLTNLTYPGAGHLIEPPFTPHFRATNFIESHTKEKIVLLWGGQTKPHSDAQEDSWRKILSFLQQHLYNNSDLRAKL